jgi:hypothetical protein
MSKNTNNLEIKQILDYFYKKILKTEANRSLEWDIEKTIWNEFHIEIDNKLEQIKTINTKVF